MIKDQKSENQFLANASQNNRPYSKFPHCVLAFLSFKASMAKMTAMILSESSQQTNNQNKVCTRYVNPKTETDFTEVQNLLSFLSFMA